MKIKDKEKQRILELHYSTPMKPFLFEQFDLLNKIKSQNPTFSTKDTYLNPNKNVSVGQKLSKDEVEKIRKVVGWNPYTNEALEFQKKILGYLEEAKNWWRNWLNNGNIRIKFKKLNGILLDSEVDEIYSKYFDIMNNINYIGVFYSNPITDEKYGFSDMNGTTVAKDGLAVAYVTKNDWKRINVNFYYKIKDKDFWVNSLVHEIQHILYYFRPLTPNNSITNFRNDDGCYKTINKIYNDEKIEYKDKLLSMGIDDEKINMVAKDLGFDFDKTESIVKSIINTAYAGWGTEYFFENNNELSSRVVTTKKILLSNTNRTELTKEDFIKLFEINKNFNQINDQIKYVLSYWATRGFEPLDDFVNMLNTSFVKTDNNIPNQSKNEINKIG